MEAFGLDNIQDIQDNLCPGRNLSTIQSDPGGVNGHIVNAKSEQSNRNPHDRKIFHMSYA